MATGRTLDDVMDMSPARIKAMEAATLRARAADALLVLHATTAANAAAWGKGTAARALAAELQKRATQ